MTDRRPDRVYGIVTRDGRAFLVERDGSLTLPGGVFRPLADNRKTELKAHLFDQLGIDARNIWAQGAFDYQAPGEERAWFSGFYTVWEWAGEPPTGTGRWLTKDEVAETDGLPAALRTLLLSVLDSVPMRTR